MKIKVSEATPLQLNWLVAKIEGFDNGNWLPDYSTEWCHGGQIIEREGINLECVVDPKNGGFWHASLPTATRDFDEGGETPLIAAMRCFVSSRLGDEVEVPEELLGGTNPDTN